MADFGNNPGFARKVETQTWTIPAGETRTSSTFNCYTYALICGTLKADKVCDLYVWQGPAEAQLDAGRKILTTAGDGETGKGDTYEERIRAFEGYGQVRVTNTSAETATVRLHVCTSMG